MPVKNAGRYLKPCLESILTQSYEDWELIAINDNSTDGSKEILLDYAKRYENIQTRDNKGEGIVSALRMAYKFSKRDIIHRMDADDLMPMNKLKIMCEGLTEGSVVTGKVKYFCDSHKIGDGFKKYESWLNLLMDEGYFWRDVYRECPIPSSAWMMYRKDFNGIGAFDSEGMPEDYDLGFRIYGSKLKINRLRSLVHYWRDSETRVSRNEKKYFPIAYYPLKVRYFLKLDRDSNKKLVLWGAGKKGKIIAKLLLEAKVSFTWITDNTKKIGVDIYGEVLKSTEDVDLKTVQTMVAVSSPNDIEKIQERLDFRQLSNHKDYFWFS
ncbi:MAG: glycosyl transferase family 2 [Bacteroidetes bacterium]|nr:MAG: glycosyl transferase family 2 [Bacteroidota bacterium]